MGTGSILVSGFALFARVGYVTVRDLVRCVTEGLWDLDLFLKAVFRYGFMGTVIGAVSSVEQKGSLSFRQVNVRAVREFFGVDAAQPVDGKFRFDREEDNTPEMELAHRLYRLLVPTFLQVELRRGESPTPFSDYVTDIRVVYGIPAMIQVLTAMGQDVLLRGYDYRYSRSVDRRTVLSTS